MVDFYKMKKLAVYLYIQSKVSVYSIGCVMHFSILLIALQCFISIDLSAHRITSDLI